VEDVDKIYCSPVLEGNLERKAKLVG